jgi:uroporphyrin-III C-methyltransferase/precorrin-2 dehydrogenase/sirohydrochlorin ferrochelatase
LALEQAGVTYEIIPGVSSLNAAPAAAGIVITDRLFGRSLGAYSLHKREGQLPDEQEWQRMANGPETLILFMGRAVMKLACERLIHYGRDGHTPAALIINGTRPNQKVVTATLETLPGLAEHVEQSGPGLIIVGKVVDPKSG